ncbi:MAG: hypothetical protein O9327_05125 [Polaromonas sp.]|nr:hypothetical protein [Polaromonas sp.]
MNASASIFFKGTDMNGIASVQQLLSQATADGFLVDGAFSQPDAEFEMDVVGSIATADLRAVLDAGGGREPNVSFLKSLFQASATPVTHVLSLDQN